MRTLVAAIIVVTFAAGCGGGGSITDTDLESYFRSHTVDGHPGPRSRNAR